MPLNRMYRVTTFVPPEAVDGVIDGIVAQTSLRYGPYDSSAWWSGIGTEQFRPLEGSDPKVGSQGHVSRVATVRLEFALPHDRELLDRVLDDGLVPSHPWQEPAIFVDDVLATASHLSEASTA